MDNNTSVADSELTSSRVGARQRWQSLIDEQRNSGLNVSAFCRQRSIPQSSFFHWRRKLGATGRKPIAGTRPDRIGFAEVKVIAASALTPAMKVDAPRQIVPSLPAMEVQLRGDRRLIVRSGFDRTLLIDLVQTLEAMSPASEPA